MLLRVSEINWTPEQEAAAEDMPHSDAVVKDVSRKGKVKFPIQVSRRDGKWWLHAGIRQLALAKRAGLVEVECFDVGSNQAAIEWCGLAITQGGSCVRRAGHSGACSLSAEQKVQPSDKVPYVNFLVTSKCGA